VMDNCFWCAVGEERNTGAKAKENVSSVAVDSSC
jgi:hypothetical protein